MKIRDCEVICASWALPRQQNYYEAAWSWLLGRMEPNKVEHGGSHSKRVLHDLGDRPDTSAKCGM